MVVLGATGSIGRSTLDVIRHGHVPLRPLALAGGRNADAMIELARELSLEAVAMADPEAARRVREALGRGVDVLDGPGAAAELARWPGVDLVVNAVVGAAGLEASLATLELGRTLALANKESLVAAGALLTRVARARGATILPIDSEHCSLFQCLSGRDPSSVRQLVLTASGGAFRGRDLDEVDALPAEEALRHPTWEMGPRITVDSATLMNKGFEVIEAHWLFSVAPEKIAVVVHPESVVHGMVTLTDGSQIAHLSRPDMRLPIEFCLAWPDPPSARFEVLDLAQVGALTFEAPDREAFRCLGLAEAALRRGGTHPAGLNAADEVCVEAYLAGMISFRQIAEVIEHVLDHHPDSAALELDAVREADRRARAAARDRIAVLAASR
jgi:1-deoxy-D-xylulose-5-phosphate reductoisomerase